MNLLRTRFGFLWERVPRQVVAIMIAFLFVLSLVACAHRAPKESFELVLVGGRVIDPESGLDAIRNIGIRNQSIAAVTTAPIIGDITIDVGGLVVAPGFIDIHSHSPTPFGARQQLLDGVTTQLDLEAGAFPISSYGEYFGSGAPVNFGASVSHMAVRTKVLSGKQAPYIFSRNGAQPGPEVLTRAANPIEIEAMRALFDEGLRSGGIGIGVLLDYISTAVSSAELRMIFEAASRHGAPVTVHVRRGLPGDPAGLDEVIALAEATKTPLLICHIVHSAMQRTDEWLAKIDAANARGARISAETLTYSAGGTAISAAVFGRDWQSIFNISYQDVQWTATGEWLTEESFHRFRREQPGGMVNHHYVKEDWIRQALRWPNMMIVSDATPVFDPETRGNPNLSGTFSRLLGLYARDQGILSLSDAIAKTSLLQAQWLQASTPAFKKKGRVREGMDADLVAFDPKLIASRATYERPFEQSTGIQFVIVGGKPAVVDGALQETVTAGKRLLAQIKN